MSVAQTRMIGDLQERLNDALDLALESARSEHGVRAQLLPLRAHGGRTFEECVEKPCVGRAPDIEALRKSRLPS